MGKCLPKWTILLTGKIDDLCTTPLTTLDTDTDIGEFSRMWSWLVCLAFSSLLFHLPALQNPDDTKLPTKSQCNYKLAYNSTSKCLPQVTPRSLTVCPLPSWIYFMNRIQRKLIGQQNVFILSDLFSSHFLLPLKAFTWYVSVWLSSTRKNWWLGILCSFTCV